MPRICTEYTFPVHWLFEIIGLIMLEQGFEDNINPRQFDFCCDWRLGCQVKGGQHRGNIIFQLKIALIVG